MSDNDMPTSSRPSGKQFVPEWVSNRKALLKPVDPNKKIPRFAPKKKTFAPPAIGVPDDDDINTDDELAWEAYGVSRSELSVPPPTEDIESDSDDNVVEEEIIISRSYIPPPTEGSVSDETVEEEIIIIQDEKSISLESAFSDKEEEVLPEVQVDENDEKEKGPTPLHEPAKSVSSDPEDFGFEKLMEQFQSSQNIKTEEPSRPREKSIKSTSSNRSTTRRRSNTTQEERRPQPKSQEKDSFWGNPVRTINPTFLHQNKEGYLAGEALPPVSKKPAKGLDKTRDPPTSATETSSEEDASHDGHTSDWGPPARIRRTTRNHLTSVTESIIEDTMKQLKEPQNARTKSTKQSSRIDFSGQRTTKRKNKSSASTTSSNSEEIRRYYGIGMKAKDTDEKMRCQYMPTIAPALADSEEDQRWFDWLPPKETPYSSSSSSHAGSASYVVEDIEVSLSEASSSFEEYTIDVETETEKERLPRHIFAPSPKTQVVPTREPRTRTNPGKEIVYYDPRTKQGPGCLCYLFICFLLVLIPGLTFFLVYYLLGFDWTL